ncbi:MAG: effector-associated domain EAD1-containing protein [Xenococcaceae cyanobacterium]
MQSRELTGSQLGEVADALEKSFTEPKLRIMLKRELELEYNVIKKGEDYQERIFNLAEDFNRKGEIYELLEAAIRNKKTNNQDLILLQQKLFPEPAIITGDIWGACGVNPQSQEFAILNQAWNELVTIIDSVNLNLIKEIVCQSLPTEVIAKGPEITNIQDVQNLRQTFLEDYRKRDDGIPRVIYFAQCLYCYPKIESSLKEKLDSWLKKITQQLNVQRPACPKKQATAIEFFLLIVARPESDRLRLIAELHPDPDNSLPSLPIDLEESQKGILCSFDEIPKYLAKYICKAQDEHLIKCVRNRCPYDLNLELFLPNKYLGERVDSWEFCFPKKSYETPKIGEKYPLVVRSSNRTQSVSSANNLLKGWRMLQDFNQETSRLKDLKDLSDRVHVPQRDYQGNWKQLGIDIEKKIGLVFIDNFPKSNDDKIQLFEKVVESGIPFFLWARCCHLPLDYLKGEFEKIVTLDSVRDFRNLIKTVFEMRKQAYACPKEVATNHLGSHLGLLCENPDRVPTDYLAIATGQ